jgi:hypothetical protein
MRFAGFLVLAALSFSQARASDFVGIYGIISRVVFEPNADHPERVQVFGVFSVAANTNGSEYLPAQRGYLYFKLPDSRQDLALHEWADLKETAGTQMVIAFSGRLVGPDFPPPRVRKPDEKRSAPDVYHLGTGTTKVRSDTQYPPVRSLLESR